MVYKYLNVMVSHIYAKHKDIGADEVQQIVADHLGEKATTSA
jgi:hypothetical protein